MPVVSRFDGYLSLWKIIGKTFPSESKYLDDFEVFTIEIEGGNSRGLFPGDKSKNKFSEFLQF